MSFEPEQPEIPASIGDIVIILAGHPDKTKDKANYKIQVLQEDGVTLDVKRGNLAPHLTPAQITALKTFMSDIRTLAQGLLP